MAGAVADSTQDWLLPEQSRPPLIGELALKVEEALATARASEAAVISVGAAALDAAEQARRAAELAERASAAVLAGSPPPAPEPELDTEDERLRDFHARADFIASRLQRLQRVPLATADQAGELRCDPAAS
ncbi:MAG TPA: hypothetical protein VFW48_08775 [Solirubrobacterales bacterium]|nr:hypothetical protein [Solirubrobacterales bacterium]